MISRLESLQLALITGESFAHLVSSRPDFDIHRLRKVVFLFAFHMETFGFKFKARQRVALHDANVGSE